MGKRSWDEATTELLGDGRVVVALRNANPWRCAAVLHRDLGVRVVVVNAKPGPAGWTAMVIGTQSLPGQYALRDQVAELLAQGA